MKSCGIPPRSTRRGADFRVRRMNTNLVPGQDWLRRSFARLAILALLLHSLLPLLHHAAMRMAAAQASLDSIVICSATGFRVVKLDSAGQPIAGDETPAPADPGQTLRYCPVCTAAAPAQDLIIPILPLLPLPALLAAVSYSPPALPDVLRPALFAGQPRAPPLFR